MSASVGFHNDNVDLVRRAFVSFNAGDVDACLAVIAEDFVMNLAGAPQMRGRETWAQNFQVMQAGFPGLQATVDDIFGADDRVAVRLTFRGVHRGPFLEVPATGRDVSFTSIELYRVADGRLAEEWIASDIPTLMRQLTGPAGPAGADLSPPRASSGRPGG